jgi:protein ImuB
MGGLGEMGMLGGGSCRLAAASAQPEFPEPVPAFSPASALHLQAAAAASSPNSQEPTAKSQQLFPRRLLSLFLPDWPTDRLLRLATAQSPKEAARLRERPFVTAAMLGSRRIVAAADPKASAAGILPGLPLADAQAMLPGLVVFEADPARDAAALVRLGEWCSRYTPQAAADPPDGLLLDITGCAHFWQGEAGLAADLEQRLAGFGFSCRIAIADTAAASWGLARFGASRRVVVAGAAMRDLCYGLPAAALRLPAETVMGLERLGLFRIGDLEALPRGVLARRCGAEIPERLDRMLGRAAEALAPLPPPADRRCRLAFAEPISEAADLERALSRLIAEACRKLMAKGEGARRLVLSCYRVDGRVQQAAIGTARPQRDTAHLLHLFQEKLAAIQPSSIELGPGIEAIVLDLPVVEPLAAAQLRLHTGSPSSWREQGDETAEEALAALLDRLGARLSPESLHRIAPRESHVPERAVHRISAAEGPAASGTVWPVEKARPLRLFRSPEPIEAMAPLPDDPPVLFRWRRLLHRVRHAEGPERIADEWWLSGDTESVERIRDYYRVEDEGGRRFWLYRSGLYERAAVLPPRWYLHGIFA